MPSIIDRMSNLFRFKKTVNTPVNTPPLNSIKSPLKNKTQRKRVIFNEDANTAYSPPLKNKTIRKRDINVENDNESNIPPLKNKKNRPIKIPNTNTNLKYNKPHKRQIQNIKSYPVTVKNQTFDTPDELTKHMKLMSNNLNDDTHHDRTVRKENLNDSFKARKETLDAIKNKNKKTKHNKNK